MACMQIISDDNQQTTARAVCVVQFLSRLTARLGGCAYYWQHLTVVTVLLIQPSLMSVSFPRNKRRPQIVATVSDRKNTVVTVLQLLELAWSVWHSCAWSWRHCWHWWLAVQGQCWWGSHSSTSRATWASRLPSPRDSCRGQSHATTCPLCHTREKGRGRERCWECERGEENKRERKQQGSTKGRGQHTHTHTHTHTYSIYTHSPV